MKNDLDIVITTFNVKDLLLDCLKSVFDTKGKGDAWNVIVIDNASTDGTADAVEKNFPNVKLITSKENLGFAKANNLARKFANAKNVLFLNPDTTVDSDTFLKMIEFFEKTPEADAATCNLILATTGLTQPESHRGFPTPWNAFCHFFGFGLPKLFPKSKLLNGYFLGHLDYSQTQTIDACVGAFFMLKRSVGDNVGWWNEKYFFYGEDLDFCWQLKQHGFSLFFFPGTQTIHYQGVSSGGINQKQKLKKK